MTVIRSRGVRRAAFTLIELLVVIAIIAILVSLSAAGVMRVLIKIPEIQTRTDMSEMDSALGSFMADYQLSDPPPSVLVLREDMSYPAGDPSGDFLRRAFGRNLTPPIDWNGDGTLNGPWVLEGEQCLVFYLGGIQSMASGTPQCLGFSTNSMNPAMAGGSRRGPYMQFQGSRLVQGPSGFFVYLDAWKSKTSPLFSTLGGSPYAYFSSSGQNNTGYLTNGMKDCQSIGALPYRDAGNNFAFSNKYQIISAGQNGQFGAGLWTPSAGAPDAAGRDDQANFSSRILGTGQQ
ncbi:MAG TPA: prepilin-type N-terminal cleavage/methylation domain-containing protein [Gemmataceae bacterium]|jgi:general secretion pathway protein G